jgi:hypothetical protein
MIVCSYNQIVNYKYFQQTERNAGLLLRITKQNQRHGAKSSKNGEVVKN